MDNEDVVDELNKLIENCKDGEYGFRTCAEHAERPEIRSVLMARSQDCARGAAELQAIVTRLGGDADTGGSASGAVHRGWVSVVSAFSGKSDKAILDEAERGEDVALERYRDAMKCSFPSDIAAVVQRQYEGTKKNHDQIRSLRDQAKASS